MLSRFDWLRRSRTGAELLATLRYLEAICAEEQGRPGDIFPSPPLPVSPAPQPLGPPPSALNGPCLRCWISPRAATKPHARYCPTCQAILDEAWQVEELSHHGLVVWGFVNQLPRPLQTGSGFRDRRLWGAYVHDQHRFLVMLYHLEIKPWLQELVIYHGPDLKGLIQIIPTTGVRDATMGDLLCRMIHHEARFPMDRLRVRFFSVAHQVFAANLYDREGILTFEITDFLSLLDMASVFRSILSPDEQESLYKLLNMKYTSEAQFYWGRFLGSLSQEARDLLNAWNIRQWSKPRIHLLYELAEDVGFYPSR